MQLDNISGSCFRNYSSACSAGNHFGPHTSLHSDVPVLHFLQLDDCLQMDPIPLKQFNCCIHVMDSLYGLEQWFSERSGIVAEKNPSYFNNSYKLDIHVLLSWLYMHFVECDIHMMYLGLKSFCKQVSLHVDISLIITLLKHSAPKCFF